MGLYPQILWKSPFHMRKGRKPQGSQGSEAPILLDIRPFVENRLSEESGPRIPQMS